jgi:hypothetical protein
MRRSSTAGAGTVLMMNRKGVGSSRRRAAETRPIVSFSDVLDAILSLSDSVAPSPELLQRLSRSLFTLPLIGRRRLAKHLIMQPCLFLTPMPQRLPPARPTVEDSTRCSLQHAAAGILFTHHLIPETPLFHTLL